ncbi:AGE family epimerase/isomerase [Caballeronia sp. J97]|uniref:AGE family epimerase/isomerase n=1 Tax=Caballeronia sp. J97 TaxID=2805429 RepID=UPI002AB09D05|nr:AGE family epimerase/isomerase [Caballeronia sp. J97]
MPAPSPSHPDFRSRSFLLDHALRTMTFYHPHCMDPAGGFYHFYKNDGTIYDRKSRHLMSSTRFVFNYAMAYKHFGLDEYRGGVAHGVEYLRDVHRNPQTGGYAWTLNGRDVTDAINRCHGLASVALAYAKAVEAGFDEARAWLDETWNLMETHFWDARHGLYKDEASADWQVSDYRGQHANMHACEALLAAFEATREARYLDRAALLADNVVNRQAALAGGLVWEHYKPDWSIDRDYEKGGRSNVVRPRGFLPGHQTQWAKLLLILDRHRPEAWHVARARELFDRALELSWDHEHGGMVHGIDPEGKFCDEDKHFWVQAESLAAAALLADHAQRDGDAALAPRYWNDYDRLWTYSWEHFVDHKWGAWYRILTRDNRQYSDEKSPAGKTDYHTMGACYEVLNVVR